MNAAYERSACHRTRGAKDTDIKDFGAAPMKNIIKLAVLIALTFFVVSPASADYLPGEKTAAEQVDGYEMVLSYLETEQFFPSRLEFRKLSADAVQDLADIALSKRIKTPIRARAIQSLALYVDDNRAVEAIDTLMEKTRPGRKLFPAVLVAYAHVHGEDVAEEIAELAQHRRADVRIAAVIALGRFGGQEGYETILRLQEVEKTEKVLAVIRNYTN